MYPIVRRSLELMDEEGMIDLPLKVNGLEVVIEPQSPLAMASNMEKVSNVLNFLQMSQALGGAGNALIKPEAVGDYILDNMGIDASLRTTPEERHAIMQQGYATTSGNATARSTRGCSWAVCPGSPTRRRGNWWRIKRIRLEILTLWDGMVLGAQYTSSQV